MRAWLKRLWAEMNEMPGPVWVFGAWAITRFVKWVFYVMPVWIPCGSEMDAKSFWLSIGSLAGMLVGQLLPLWALWTLLKKKPYAVSLASLYIGMKAIAQLVAVITITVQSFNPAFEWAQVEWFDQGPAFIVWFALCAAFLLYLELSGSAARAFPEQQRRRVPGFWAVGVVAFAVVVLLGQ